MMSVTEGKSILLEKTTSNNAEENHSEYDSRVQKIENRISCLLICSSNRTLCRGNVQRQTLQLNVFGCTIIIRVCYNVAICVKVHKCCVCVCVCVCVRVCVCVCK